MITWVPPWKSFLSCNWESISYSARVIYSLQVTIINPKKSSAAAAVSETPEIAYSAAINWRGRVIFQGMHWRIQPVALGGGGGAPVWPHQANLTPNSCFSSDFGHFIFKMRKNKNIFLEDFFFKKKTTFWPLHSDSMDTDYDSRGLTGVWRRP